MNDDSGLPRVEYYLAIRFVAGADSERNEPPILIDRMNIDELNAHRQDLVWQALKHRADCDPIYRSRLLTIASKPRIPSIERTSNSPTSDAAPLIGVQGLTHDHIVSDEADIGQLQSLNLDHQVVGDSPISSDKTPRPSPATRLPHPPSERQIVNVVVKIMTTMGVREILLPDLITAMEKDGWSTNSQGLNNKMGTVRHAIRDRPDKLTIQNRIVRLVDPIGPGSSNNNAESDASTKLPESVEKEHHISEGEAHGLIQSAQIPHESTTADLEAAEIDFLRQRSTNR